MNNKPYEEEQEDNEEEQEDNFPLQPEPYSEWDEMVCEVSGDPEEAAKEIIKLRRENTSLREQITELKENEINKAAQDFIQLLFVRLIRETRNQVLEQVAEIIDQEANSFDKDSEIHFIESDLHEECQGLARQIRNLKILEIKEDIDNERND